MSSLRVGGMYRVPWVTWALDTKSTTKLNVGDLIVILSQELVQNQPLKSPLFRFTVLCPSGVTGYIILACSGLFYWKEANLALSLSDAPQTSP